MSIDNFKDIKTAWEIEQHGSIYDFAAEKAEENDDFLGVELDEAKKKRLDAIGKLCEQVASLNSTAKYKRTMLDNQSRHGMEQIEWKSLALLTDRKTLDALSELFRLSDNVWLASPVGGGILMSFCVCDIWSRWERISEQKN